MDAVSGKIVSSKHIKHIFYRMEIFCPAVAFNAEPGQFVMIHPNQSAVPFLGRPFGIAGVDRERGTFEIVFQAVGEGTQLLANLPINSEVGVIGALGHGFTVDPEHKRVLLVAGGIGIAPLLYLARALSAAGTKVKVLIGARRSDLLICTDDLFAAGCELVILTDDGSVGQKGVASDCLPQLLTDEKYDFIYACGRNILMRKVTDIAEQFGVPCEVSLEERMGCGVGICMSCVCDIKDEEGDGHHRERVCTCGPVFRGKDVVWND